MPNYEPKREHLQPGWNKGLEKARGVPKLKEGEISRTVRVRGPKELFDELEELNPIQIGEILKGDLLPWIDPEDKDIEALRKHQRFIWDELRQSISNMQDALNRLKSLDESSDAYEDADVDLVVHSVSLGLNARWVREVDDAISELLLDREAENEQVS